MGTIVGAGLVSHVPTMVLPEPVRLELNDGHEISLVPGLRRLRAQVLDRLRPDTIVVLDSHWFTTVEFAIAAHERRKGHFTSDELPRGMSAVAYDIPGDPELAHAVAEEANAAGTWMSAIDDPYLPIHYPTVNLLGFLQGDERWVSMSLPQTGETDDFLVAGAAIGRAIERVDRRVVLLASGALSHRFWPLRQLREHEASDPVHIRTPEARDADLQRLSWFADGEHARVIDTMPEFLVHKPEGNFGHYLMMVAAIGGRGCRAPGELFSEYENSIGTGHAHVWFECPAGGWTSSD